MSEAEIHDGSEHYSPPAGDVIVCLLGALVAAGLAWSVVFGLFAGANYGITQFQIALPQIALDGLNIGAQVLPLLAALIAGFVGFRFLVKLP